MGRDLGPPGSTERVHADSVLVLAPHYDDEVLGCGGLVAQLTDAGAVARVLFLTDSSGGIEAIDDREAYRRRRRQEAAQAVAALGLAGADHLDLPDGGLDLCLSEAASGIRRALLTQRPDLLLVPSPLEASSDHRAAFAALHQLLTPLRRGDSESPEEVALRVVVEGLKVLVYEGNRPAYPELLVDVSEQLPRLEAAMACYSSQQERHDYLKAAFGLRRFRTLTLPPAIDAAEGYRRLGFEDFTTRSLSQLITHLGGLPELLEVTEGPWISVVVRTKDRPALLIEALESLAAGSYRRAEVVLVNDGGEPPPVPAEYPLPLRRLDLPENQGRAAAADAGVAAARGDFITFLDDDDLAAAEHLATLADAVAAPGVRVVYTDAAVGVYELEAGPGSGWECRERRLPYSRDFDPDLLLVDNYIPFNTLLVERSCFAEVGPFDRDLPFFEDWDFLIRLSRRVVFHHLRRVTCEYRHFRGGGHHILGERPRQRGDFLEMKSRVLAKHADLLAPGIFARVVDTLRSEQVDAREEAVSSSRQLRELADEHRRLAHDFEGLSRERWDLEERYHRLNGETQALREEAEGFRSDLQRLYDEEAKLRAVVEDQTAHLGRTYAEIERLQQLIQAMESTRAWRLHRWLTRKGR